MKKLIFPLLFALSSVGQLFASDTYVTNSAVDIYYDFDSSTLTASVTYKGSSITDYTDEYTGTVTIPDSVTYNEQTYAVTSIGKYAFYGCTSLTAVTIPSTITSIGDYAFRYCNRLTAVTIPNSVTSIRVGAFSDCTKLAAINVDAANTAYCSEDGVLYNKDKTTLVCCLGGKTGSFTIPISVTSIEQYAFYGCSGLTEITILNSVTSIGKWAFAYCSGLTAVTIPSSVTSIESNAFQYCTNLKTVTNLSALNIVKGATTHGYVAYYADVVNTPAGINDARITDQLSIVGETIQNPTYAAVSVYSIAGSKVLASQESVISIRGLAHGTYVAVTANGSVKFIR